MSSPIKRNLLVASVVAALLPASAIATNGYFAHGWGAKSKAMAGVAVAFPQDTLVSAVNPAGLALVGQSLDVGIAFFSPSDRGYQANDDFGRTPDGRPTGPFVTPGRYESRLDWFLIPNIGYNHVVDDRMTVGFSLVGNGGMNTKYAERAVWENFALPPNTTVDMAGNPIGFDPTGTAPNNANPNGVFTATRPTGVNLEQLFIQVPVTYRLNASHAVGIAPVFAVQRFRAEGLEPFRGASLYPDRVSNNGDDWSYGVGLHLGWIGNLTEELTLGASYRSQIWMTAFDDYKGLFADEGRFDVPAMLNLGLAYKALPTLVVGFDYQRIFYSDIRAIANSNNLDIQPCFGPGPKANFCLGGANGLGFGWKDMDIVKFGASWDVDPAVTLRAGVSHASEFAPSGQALFNVLAPATVRWHYTLGASYRPTARDEFSLSFAYMPKEEIRGQNQNITGSQTGSVFMEQKDIEISWSRSF
ncbi:outer membrane protein transport protein [Thioalkalicoccus limnaeus]|uniref:Outer membrane protein transport protein n=1 Tax=Thioalkalicoccus limnaeus TaxID=120681 RepID=A0ABV4BJ68_9GAMM